ncbi:hypothetical protein V1514DRAFT_336738 [Lipomyces japonicus]|uniref:uncharacterized protein n=1 Tax=Lipomyces japonicus TaxID=56871 RepID=UPI0034CD6A86
MADFISSCCSQKYHPLTPPDVKLNGCGVDTAVDNDNQSDPDRRQSTQQKSKPNLVNHHDADARADNRHLVVIRRRTRTGCLTCRKRRIKCDEGKPLCANCIKSRRVCEGYCGRRKSTGSIDGMALPRQGSVSDVLACSSLRPNGENVAEVNISNLYAHLAGIPAEHLIAISNFYATAAVTAAKVAAATVASSTGQSNSQVPSATTMPVPQYMPLGLYGMQSQGFVNCDTDINPIFTPPFAAVSVPVYDYFTLQLTPDQSLPPPPQTTSSSSIGENSYGCGHPACICAALRGPEPMLD